MTRERLRFAVVSDAPPGAADLADVAVDGLLARCGPDGGDVFRGESLKCCVVEDLGREDAGVSGESSEDDAPTDMPEASIRSESRRAACVRGWCEGESLASMGINPTQGRVECTSVVATVVD